MNVEVFSWMAPHHAKRIAERYGLTFVDVRSGEVPKGENRLLVGCWPFHWQAYYEALLDAKRTIIYWIGTDVLVAVMGHVFNSFGELWPNAVHWTDSRALADELRDIDIDARVVVAQPEHRPAFSADHGTAIAVSWDPTRPGFFRKSLIDRALERFPNRKVYWLPTKDGYTNDMDEVFRETSILIRIPIHDGFSHAVAEFRMAGCAVLHTTGDVSVEQIVRAIEKAPERMTVRPMAEVYRQVTDERHLLKALEDALAPRET